MMSGYDFPKSQVLRRLQKVGSDWEVAISSGSVFQTRGPATVKARSLTVECLVGGTIRRLVPPQHNVPGQHNVRRLGRLALGILQQFHTLQVAPCQSGWLICQTVH